MTHTLNRKGLSENKPGEEIIFLAMVHQKNKRAQYEEMKKLAETVLKYNPDNMIGMPNGATAALIPRICAGSGIATAVFSNKNDVIKLIEDIKSKSLGISVVLSGLFADVRDVCKSTDLKEHTHNISLGIFGRTEKLPDEKILEITTQCGHALISPFHVEHIVSQIKKGKITPMEGAKRLIKPCVCGIGNAKRTANILNQMTELNRNSER